MTLILNVIYCCHNLHQTSLDLNTALSVYVTSNVFLHIFQNLLNL